MTLLEAAIRLLEIRRDLPEEATAAACRIVTYCFDNPTEPTHKLLEEKPNE